MAQFVCDKSHDHAAVQGSDTVKTGFYNKEVAEGLLDGLGIVKKRVVTATATAAPQCNQLNESRAAAPQCTQSNAVDVDSAPQRIGRKSKRQNEEDAENKIESATVALVAALTERFSCGKNKGKGTGLMLSLLLLRKRIVILALVTVVSLMRPYTVSKIQTLSTFIATMLRCLVS